MEKIITHLLEEELLMDLPVKGLIMLEVMIEMQLGLQVITEI